MFILVTKKYYYFYFVLEQQKKKLVRVPEIILAKFSKMEKFNKTHTGTPNNQIHNS